MTIISEVFSDGALVERVADNGDGTGVRTTYAPDGTVLSTEAVSGLPIPVEPAPNAAEVAVSLAEQARQEVAGYSPTNGARQAVEKLADAVVTLVQGGQS